MSHSLLAVVLSAAAARIATNEPMDIIDDHQLIEALKQLSTAELILPFCEVKQTDTIERLLAEAVRVGCETALDWWTGSDPTMPYHDISSDKLLTPRLVADTVPELYTRYLLLEDKT